MIWLFAFIITFLVGPFTFFILSRTLKLPKKLKKFPVGINDGVGDLVFLPYFNAVLFYLGVQFNSELFFAFIISFLGVFVYYYLDKKSNYVDWSKPQKNKYNFGGYYHLIFFLLQLTLIIYGLSNYFLNIYLWIPIIGYLLSVSAQFLFFDHW